MDQQREFRAAYGIVSRRVNSRKFDGPQGAFTMSLVLVERWPHYAESWFIHGLSAQLSGRGHTAAQAWERAKLCNDYTPQLEGDFLRDKVLDQIRRWRKNSALVDMINQIELLHAGDANRLACLKMVRGRWNYLYARWFDAAADHYTANKGLTDEQWWFNNLLPWLKAAVMRGADKSLMSQIYVYIKDDCPPRKPDFEDYHGTRGVLWRARLAAYGGKLGCRLDDLLQYLYWRVYVPLRRR